MSFPHLGGVLKLGFTSSFVPISSAARDESWNDAEMKPTRLVDDVLNCHHITPQASRADHDPISHLVAMGTTSPGT
jgi:hypothetical protein